MRIGDSVDLGHFSQVNEKYFDTAILESVDSLQSTQFMDTTSCEDTAMTSKVCQV